VWCSHVLVRLQMACLWLQVVEVPRAGGCKSPPAFWVQPQDFVPPDFSNFDFGWKPSSGFEAFI
jgi:hypothetical protein